MAVSVLNITESALRDLGVLAAGETATADDAKSGLDSLNSLLDQWAAEKLVICTTTRTTKALTPSAPLYTIGVGGDVNIVRPVYIDHVNLIDTSPDPDLERPLAEITEDQWAMIPVKDLQSTYPNGWYWNPTFGSTGRGALTLWPVPTGTTLQIAIYAPTAVPEFTASSDIVSLPPGYRRMLIKNLAIELASSYTVQVSPDLRQQASDAKAIVKRANRRLMDMAFPAASLVQGRDGYGRYDILSDRYL